MFHLSLGAVWADAVFVSMLQRSEGPSAGQVRDAVAAALRAYGGRGCAARVAQEFGDHPEIAVARMRWARAVAGKVFVPVVSLSQAGDGATGAAPLRLYRPRYRPPARCPAPSSGRSL